MPENKLQGHVASFLEREAEEDGPRADLFAAEESTVAVPWTLQEVSALPQSSLDRFLEFVFFSNFLIFSTNPNPLSSTFALLDCATGEFLIERRIFWHFSLTLIHFSQLLHCSIEQLPPATFSF